MNHYGTLQGAELYHQTSANGSVWSSTEYDDAKRTAALIRASRSLDGQYGRRYPGTPTGGRSQVLGWPRVNAYDHCANELLDHDIVPYEIENATYALALIELQTPGASSPNFTPSAVRKREWVDGVGGRENFGPSDGVSLSLDMQRMQVAEVVDALRCILTNNGATQCVLRV